MKYLIIVSFLFLSACSATIPRDYSKYYRYESVIDKECALKNSGTKIHDEVI